MKNDTGSRVNGAKCLRIAALFLIVVPGTLSYAPIAAGDEPPIVTEPPESFFELVNQRDRDVAQQFYKKYLPIKGIPVVAAQAVADQALQRTHDIVTHLLAGRPDIIDSMVKDRMYLIIIGKDQVYTDMPEYRRHPNPAYQNERVRGTGGKPTSFGEENLLCLPIDRYDDESIVVHEFCHTIDSALRSIDPIWREQKNRAYRQAISRGLWKNTYAASNAGEFWAEICQSFFDCNRVHNWNHGPVGTREQLQAYDPDSYELVRKTFNLEGEQDWRYSWLQKPPMVTTPPERFRIDSHYAKFTWAREFTVIGRQASDAALLKANDTIRKMFAYRHDLLKSLIDDGVKLVVLGTNERITDLPEYRGSDTLQPIDPSVRSLDYSPDTKLLVVDEQNLLPSSVDERSEDDQVVRVFAKAIYYVTGARPVDPNWDNPARAVQQYELRVKRLDVRFDEKLKDLYERSIAAGKWKDTMAARDRASYWAAGVLAYFDAANRTATPSDIKRPIATRESLEEYDPGLFALVDETMAYKGHEAWRASP